MPAKDFDHDTVRNSLMKDGWTVTYDPFRLPIGGRSVFIEIGATKVFAAERQEEKIAVEVKSFLSPSPISELDKAMEQYDLYSMYLENEDPERLLFLAIPSLIFQGFFLKRLAREFCAAKNYGLLFLSRKVRRLCNG